MIGSPLMQRTTPWVSLLDLRVNRFSARDIARLVADLVQIGEHSVIANHNLHSLYLWYREPRMRQFYAGADYIHIDGMSLVWLGNTVGLPLKRRDRATSVDFLPLLLEQAVEHGWRIFYLGSKPGIADKGAATLLKRYPGLQIQTRHGHFDADQSCKENKEVLAQINAYAPNILFVGMGMPRQEMWILENQPNLNANVIFPAGALMDYMAGEISTPPRWLASLYLEWLYRLVSEPKRLRRRYLVEPWFVLGQTLKYSFGFRIPDLAAQNGQND
jgi:N-acetylglucosaminyldiphosphoundecaprenol N-acetyl-beta-D-mannosaminyltransferase